MKIRPCIDIHNGTVKQIVGGTLKDGSGRESGSARENFVAKEDARYYASLYKEKGLGGGHIILLNSVKEEEAYLADKKQAFAALKAFPGGMQAGGGITPVTAGGFLEAGASHVIVTSYVFRDGRLSETALKEMIRAVGTKRLVLDLSCRRRQDGRYVVVTDRWQKYTDLVVNEQTLDRLKDHCDEFLIHAADIRNRDRYCVHSGALAERVGISNYLCGRRALRGGSCCHQRTVRRFHGRDSGERADSVRRKPQSR